MLGNFVQYWDGVPICASDWILDTHVISGGVETGTTGGMCSSIYALQMGGGRSVWLDGARFCDGGADRFAGNQRCNRNRIKWYVSLALFSAIKGRRIDRVQDN